MRLTFIREQRWPEVLYDEYLRRRTELPGPLDDETAARIWHEVELWMLRDSVEVNVDAETTTGVDLRDLAFDRLATDEERRVYAQSPWLVQQMDLLDLVGQSYVTSQTLAEIGALENILLQLRVPPIRYFDPFVSEQLRIVGDPVVALDRLVASDGLVPGDEPVLWGVLLYTDEDEALATYVRRHFDELDALSGETFQIMVMEDRGTRAELHFYWRNRVRRERIAWRSLGWLRTKPYKRERAYEVARRYNVRADQLPCLMLVGGPERDGRIVFPIRQVSPGYLRTLFSELTEAANAGDGKDAWDRVSSAHEQILDQLTELDDGGTTFRFHGYTVVINPPSGSERESTMGDTFHFHGDTTFVNKPAYVVLRDFQNRYGTSTESPGTIGDVSRLVELAMCSDSLAVDDKELVVSELHDLAEQLTHGEETGDEQPTPRMRLEKVSAILSRAADVAEPSARLLASVFGALG